jgi:Poly(ADP-ribose) polymerase catalytic domain/WGR domain
MISMADKNVFPVGTTADDWKCFGPIATEDTKFAGTCMADMGCFQQDSTDSNKYLHCAKVQDKKTGRWGFYNEWGRVGAGSPQWQLTLCASEAEAQKLYEKKCHEKNTKRGEWTNIAGKQMFRPIVKNGKPEDLYVIRNLAKRDVGLPDAKTITSPDHVVAPAASTKVGKKTFRCDPKTTQLMRDLLGGAVTYARTSLVGGATPSQKAIDDARDILGLAMKRLGAVGSDIQSQVADKDLKQLTYALYGYVPKIKPLGAPDKDWILSADNIKAWSDDLDAFETALKADTGVIETGGNDPMEGFPLDMEWVDPKSDLGRYLYQWWPKAATRSHNYGALKIKNLWKIDRHGDRATFDKDQARILKELGTKGYNGPHRAMHQDRERADLTSAEKDLWWKSNSALLFHGSATQNVPGILRTNLRLPDPSGVAVNGWAFGPGIYKACSWGKSAGYTSLSNSFWSRGKGGVEGRDAFMFAGDCVLGNPHLVDVSDGFRKYPAGTHVIFGKGGHTKFGGAYRGNGQLVNHEWIFFDRKPLLRYLIEFTA